VGLATLISFVFWSLYKHNRLATTVLLVIWTFHSYQTLRLTEKVHWTVQEAKEVISTIEKSKRLYPNIPASSTVVIRYTQQIQQSLYGDLGMQFAYNDPTIITHFGNKKDIMPSECAKLEDKYPCLEKHKIFLVR